MHDDHTPPYRPRPHHPPPGALPIWLCLAVLPTLPGCGAEDDAERIIRQAIEAHGGRYADEVVIGFDFRGDRYTITLDEGFFQHERERVDSLGTIRDVLNNDTFYREINGRRVDLPDTTAADHMESINSVAYFMLLPFKLTDAAVQARYLTEEEIGGEPYHEIEVTFRQEGGGRDYQDRFVYWFHRDHHTMDYLAYDYLTGDTGTRFREAFRARTVGGIRFQDYRNLTSSLIGSPGDPIEQLDSLLQTGELDTVSIIESTQITVRPVDTSPAR